MIHPNDMPLPDSPPGDNALTRYKGLLIALAIGTVISIIAFTMILPKNMERLV